MKNLLKGIILANVVIWYLFPLKVIAHGEDKKGPHGGFIKMPGAFHCEVVPLNDNSFKVYLLDMSFAAPITANSWVKASVNTESKKAEASCKISDDAFVCTLPKEVSLKIGTLEVLTLRENLQGALMIYELPLATEVKEHH